MNHLPDDDEGVEPPTPLDLVEDEVDPSDTFDTQVHY